jgi:hypothetical protein
MDKRPIIRNGRFLKLLLVTNAGRRWEQSRKGEAGVPVVG